MSTRHVQYGWEQCVCGVPGRYVRIHGRAADLFMQWFVPSWSVWIEHGTYYFCVHWCVQLCMPSGINERHKLYVAEVYAGYVQCAQ